MKTVLKYSLLIPILLTFLIFNSCKHGSDAENSEGSETKENVLKKPSNLVITKAQFEKAGMKLGSPELMPFMQKVSANGYIEASPTGIANISVPIQGKVTKINVRLGDAVKKGELLFTLESSEIIMLQQEYAEAFAKAPLMKSNYERMKNLSSENITAGKELIKAESEYKTLLNTMEGLKARLSLIGINYKEIEKGMIHSKANITAPISGNISELDLVLGQYMQAGETKMKIIDAEQLQLHLYVFERDIELLSKGQTIEYFSPGKHLLAHQASLEQIGRSVNKESKTIKCIAAIDPADKQKFVHRSFVEADIITCEREALALPLSSVLEEDNRFYVFRKIEETEDAFVFRKIPIKTGVLQNEQVEVLEEGLSDLLVEGSYNLNVD